ncbi:neuronal pentraxin-2 [Alosa pseudoharengus]|uniref:neuronal pentraxin-2 n=1 Tax=Alosa pseudoharengus TaxID=34774 RepID=UPI003F8A42EC
MPGLAGGPDPGRLFSVFLKTLLLVALFCGSDASAPEYDYVSHPRFICTPIPADADPGCFPTAGGPLGASTGGPSSSGGGGSGGSGGSGSSWWGLPEEAKSTILHLRESLVQQKETILDQRDKIRELTAKLAMCEGFGRGMGPHDSHLGLSPHLTHHTLTPHHSGYPDSGHPSDPEGHYPSMSLGGHHRTAALGDKHAGEMTPSSSSSPEQLERMLHALKERLESLQTRNTSTTYSNSLKDLLQRKIYALEQQLSHHTSMHGRDHDDGHPDNGHYDNDDHRGERHEGEHDNDTDHDDIPHDLGHFDAHRADGSHDDRHLGGDDDDDDDSIEDDNDLDSHTYPRSSYHTQGHRTPGGHNSNLDAVLNHLQHRLTDTGSRKKSKGPDGFQIGFPMRTNYMYGRLKQTLTHEIFSLTLCLWLKGGAGPGLGTPFSYSVPGQANELVLIEWGNNPMELLVNDRAVTLPLSLSDGKWHHVCVTWSTRDGLWEAYQDGVKRGSGENLSAWHPIKPGGVFILGQEQDTLGGRFDATQAFVGEISDLQMWSHILTGHDIYNLASCNGHMAGDIIAWSESALELHGGVTSYPFDPCH